MFGRHFNLAIDAHLCLNSLYELDRSSRKHYASKLKNRLDFAYKVASKEANKSATRHMSNYDGKVREATHDVGNIVLIRKVDPRGKIKQIGGINRVLTYSNIGLFYSNVLILTPTFPKVPM